MKNRRWQRVAAVSMAVLLAGSAMFPKTAYAEAEENTILIRTAEQFLEFSKSCTLDSWSQGKTIVLMEDIDLSATDFDPIPTFGGHFQGNGHKISGLLIEDGTSCQGLFRFVQKDGLIEDLSVSGTVKASGVQEYIGGIAGNLAGTIKDCTFEGVVDADLYVGGIAGITEKTGRIEGCIAAGTVQGEKYVGGITGQNEGLVERCENRARINPVTNDEESDLESAVPGSVKDTVLKQTQTSIDNARNSVRVTQDTGGIAGYSKGTIKDCSNAGSVGYQHTGYNVGGIVGRSMGYLSGCSNSGKVLGRKDVGGIAGQLAPDIQLVFSSDTLDKLDKELDILSDLADNAMDHTDGNRNVISERMDRISDYARTASDHTSELADMTIDWADTNIDEINRMMDMLKDTIDRMTDISGSLEGVLGTMDDGIESLEDSMDQAGSALGVGKQGEKKLRGLIDELRQNNSRQKECLASIREQSKAFLQALLSGDIEGAAEASDSIKSEVDEFLEAVRKSKEDISEFSKEAADLPDIGINLRNGAEDLGDAVDSMEQSVRDMTDTAGEIRKLFRDLSDRDEIRFTPMGDDYRNKGDQVHENINSIGDQLDLLQDEVNSTGDALSDDMRKLKDQLRVINKILEDAGEEAKEKDQEDLWEDVSEEDIQNTTVGKAENCRNTGSVEGDINTGGIVGAMAVESDLDPEEDIEEVGSESFHFRYETRAILSGCTNSGTITGKMDGVGGTVGKMDLGYVLNCRNYGNAESTDGSYVGGIAGSSASTIRGSYSKCMLSGKNFVGGIAGDSFKLYHNVAFVSILDSEMYAGSIAGRADKEGEVLGNRFVDNGSAGIDGVSYAGKAEPVAYETLMAEEETPEEFRRFYLVYVADDTVAARVACTYGSRFSDLAVPSVPEKKGYKGIWETADEETVTFDHIFRAVYTPYVTAIESDVMRDDVHAVMLAEGTFDADTVLKAEKLSGDEHREQWRITLTEENAGGEEGFCKFRFIPPKEWNSLSIRLITDDGEMPVTWTKEKSACVFTSDWKEFVLLAEKTGPVNGRIVWIGLPALCLIAFGLMTAKKANSKKGDKKGK